MNKGYLIFKRFMDIGIASICLCVFLPIICLTALLVGLRLGRPVFFAQQRPGLGGHPFTVYKFRTMTDERQPDGSILPDEQRLTPFGRFLRSSSLDELPQLWSVLIGDMSLVGPRPLLMEYLPLYNEVQLRRHTVRPGITGWAQVNGRNTLSWKSKFEHDVWYVDNCSFALDIKILWLTILKVVNRDGISAAGEATMSKFTGNSND